MEESIGEHKTDVGVQPRHAYALSAGRALGQYRIVKPLGAGGMGEVYLVEHGILQTRHALKVLPVARVGSEGFIERFHNEARVMAQLRHPGIVHVTHADVTDGFHYLVMDFVCGAGDDPYDLEEALADAPDGRFAPETVAQLMGDVCAAVGYAHGRGVIHRDLKPANVLLEGRGAKTDNGRPSDVRVRVTDFGLARLVGEEWLRSVIDASLRNSLSLGDQATGARRRENRSSSGSILGTYDYMSPEQREGREADARSDVYAAGVMLYRLLTGKRLRGMAKPPSRIVAGLDEGWDELIMASLEEEPGDRPQSMAEVAERLKRLKNADEIVGGDEAARMATVEKVHLATEAAQPAPGDGMTVDLGGGIKMELAWCPPGSFMMGSPSGEPGRNNDETQHRVTLTRGFWLGKYPVTQRQWEAVMGNNPSKFKGLDLPVETVSWDDCQTFIQRLNAKLVAWGYGSTESRPPSGGVGGRVSPLTGSFRLPTEAEWEYACRAGTTGPYAGSLDDMAWYSENSGGMTHPVGEKRANVWGLYDMHGSVWEWCQDRDCDYQSESVIDPTGSGSGVYRVSRGGSWSVFAWGCRSAYRDGDAPDNRDFSLGLRLAMNPL